MQLGYSVIDQITEAYEAGYTYAKHGIKLLSPEDAAKAQGYDSKRQRYAFIDGYNAALEE